MAADDYHDGMQNIRRALGKALRMNRAGGETGESVAA
jgi:hypothetical protein